jgi:hypothetical protein
MMVCGITNTEEICTSFITLKMTSAEIIAPTNSKFLGRRFLNRLPDAVLNYFTRLKGRSHEFIVFSTKRGRCNTSGTGQVLSRVEIGGFVKKYLIKVKVSVDPFARNNRWATYTNDLNPDTAAQTHLTRFGISPNSADTNR